MSVITKAKNNTVKLSANEIYISKRNKVLPPNKTGTVEQSTNAVATISKNLECLGYTFSHELFEYLVRVPFGALTNFYKEIVPILKKQTGDHRQFRPMYPNFPLQVMMASDLELWLNAMVHYWSDGSLLPSYEKEEKVPLLDENVKLKVLGLGYETDFNSIFTQLVGGNSSISESDKEIVRWFVATVYQNDLIPLLPDSIPQKEQLALLAGEFISHNVDTTPLQKYIKTATDVLRIAVALSNGDVSLAKTTRFKNFGRPVRRFLLTLLEKCGDNRTEDMLRYKNEWIRLGERLHPGEYAHKFPNSYKSFQVLRNSEPFTTFNSAVEKAIKNQSLDILPLLTKRPGEFARRLDHVLRTQPENVSQVLSEFLEVADRVSTPVLLQVYGHFEHRGESKLRSFMPKGSIAKMQVMPNTLPPLPKYNDKQHFNLTNRIVASQIFDILTERFSKLPSLGKVYLDETLKGYPVPFSQRSASKTLHTVSRGSKLDMPDGNTIRFFIWWHDGESRTDIDLSASALTDKWTTAFDITYYNLGWGGKKDKNPTAVHSGDITSAPNGACEFIDIDINSAIEGGARYLVPQVYSYTQQPYKDLPECCFGWMARQYPGSGEIFEAKTVQNKIDLTSDTKVCIPVVFDLKDRKAIWMDLALKSRTTFWGNNTASNKQGVGLMCQAMMELQKPSLYDLFLAHTLGRGGLVENKDEADIVFDESKAFDIDEILSEYLK